VSTLTLYYPGLLGPDVPLEELSGAEWPDTSQTENLCKLLTSASSKNIQPLPKTSIEAQILGCLGLSLPAGAELPIAYYRAINHEINEQSILCLDPVHIQIDRDEAVLVANESLDISKDDALQVINDLNQHFQQDGLAIHYHNEHQWLMTGDISIDTFSMSDVMFRNMNEYQATGRDAKKWRSIINEVQMLLHEHPVNIRREQQGSIAVNSLWVWGGGQPEQHSTKIDLVYANDVLVADIARAIKIDCEAVPDRLDSNVLRDRKTLLIMTEQMHAVRQNDVFAWFDYLHLLDKEVIRPLIDMLKNDAIEDFVIVSDTVSIKITKHDLKNKFWQFWKKTSSLEDCMKSLRKQYGY